jgi:hypothetical protein
MPYLRRLMKSAVCLFALLGTTTAYGNDAAAYETPLDFALHLARLTVPLQTAGQRVTATVRQIGISSFNRGTPTLQPGLYLGYAWIDLDRTPAAALAPEGFYIGPAVRSEFLRLPRFTVTLTASYLYQRVRDSNAAQAVTLEWYQPQLDLDGLWHLTRTLGVRLGARYGRADADERLSGTVDQTVKLAREAVFGTRAGLELDLGDDGQIGCLFHQAVGDGVELYFQRQF